MAPLLRLFSIYIVHAFGIVDQVTQQALLLVGPSGSGKTTSGLTLYKEGWQFLGNDAIFLSCSGDQIIAWPSPGRINIPPNSILLLNHPDFIPSNLTAEADGKVHLKPNILFNSRQQPHSVKAILFPHIAKNNQFKMQSLPKAVALTKLMGQSIDNWDKVTLNDHLSFLQKLVNQTKSFDVPLSSDLSPFKEQVSKVVRSLK